MKDNLASKYKARLEAELGATNLPSKVTYSREYKQFRKELLPRHLTLYERMCKLFGKLKIKPPKKRQEELQESIRICHLQVTPTDVTSFGLVFPVVVGFILAMVFFLLLDSFFFFAFFLLIGLFMTIPLGKLPDYLATNWRLRSSNQMVLCIFYVVTYMRHTSNLELALDFAAEHLGPPLSLDLKKVLWDVETEKYSSLKDSLEAYLSTWRKYNQEFIESFHLIESSLYEGTEEKRLGAIDKALDIMLEETYERMLHYAHNLKSPITMLHMLGIILPILGLVIMPLVVSFLGDDVKWYHLATIYNIFLPTMVFLLGTKILSTRPTGYGDTDISNDNPQLKKYKNFIIKIGSSEIKVKPIFISVLVFFVFFLIGISPIVMHLLGVPDFGFGFETDKTSCGRDFCFLGYEQVVNAAGERVTVGPFGLGASLISILFTLGIGLSIGLYYKLRSKNVIKIREESKRLEQEFAGALFQLGNRLGDGIPTETAVGNVAVTMEGTVSGKFFQLVSNNVRSLGMSVERAIFDSKLGAILYYPSKIIESSMKVLTESVKKGPQVAARSIMNVSRYIKEIHRVDERLKDLLADVISSMKSQIKFLAPVISGIVIGITSMITNILGKLGGQLGTLADGGDSAVADVGATLALGDILGGRGIPVYYFQLMVGLYVVQIVYILTVLSNSIENGSDKLNEQYELGINLIRSTVMYCIIAGMVTLIFSLIANRILPT